MYLLGCGSDDSHRRLINRLMVYFIIPPPTARNVLFYPHWPTVRNVRYPYLIVYILKADVTRLSRTSMQV